MPIRVLYLDLSNFNLNLPNNFYLFSLNFKQIKDADKYLMTLKKDTIYFYSWNEELFLRTVSGKETKIKNTHDFNWALKLIEDNETLYLINKIGEININE